MVSVLLPRGLVPDSVSITENINGRKMRCSGDLRVWSEAVVPTWPPNVPRPLPDVLHVAGAFVSMSGTHTSDQTKVSGQEVGWHGERR